MTMTKTLYRTNSAEENRHAPVPDSSVDGLHELFEDLEIRDVYCFEVQLNFS